MQIRKHLSYANVMSTIAVVIALAGGSTAVAISASKKAPKNSVTSGSIRDGSVTANDLARVRVVSEPFFNVANCAPNEKLLGGGAIAFDASGMLSEFTSGLNRLQRSYPDGNGWRSQGVDNSRAYALCLSGAPGK